MHLSQFEIEALVLLKLTSDTKFILGILDFSRFLGSQLPITLAGLANASGCRFRLKKSLIRLSQKRYRTKHVLFPDRCQLFVYSTTIGPLGVNLFYVLVL
jgi:hypothetical protein